MGVYGGPNIVRDGLISYFDAANPQSYPTSGNLWMDLTNNKNNITLTTGITFTSLYKGGITFNGTSDWGVPTTLLPSYFVPNNFSLGGVFQATQTVSIISEATTGLGGLTGQRYPVFPLFVTTPDAGIGISMGTNGILVFEHTVNHIPALAVYSGVIGTGCNFIFIIYINKTPHIYLNGVLVRSGLTSPRTNIYPSLYIGGGSYGYHSGNIFNYMVYNKSLNTTEILQNYHAIKGRYGL